jgi:quercetin dioxygenase-like cupin family protein
MDIVDNASVETFELPGLAHQTIGGHKHGLKSTEVWLQTIAPGAETPVHRHPCEEVIVVLSGSGECIVGDETFRFGPNSTIIVEPDLVHQLVNTSNEDMRLIATFGAAPVRVLTPDGEPMDIPWLAP